MLRAVIMGTPLSARPAHAGRREQPLQQLDAHLRGVVALLPARYGRSAAIRQACAELERLIALPDEGVSTLACKRAALLFALHSEPQVQHYFADEPFARDLYERVLPFLMPRFLKHSCQSPQAFVDACLVLADMWEDEQLGNWPRGGRRTTMPPLGTCTSEATANADAPPPAGSTATHT